MQKGVVIIEKRMSYTEIIASLMLFGSGMLTVERGIFWIVETDKSMFDSHLYVTLSHAMPLFAWGVLFTLSGMFVILASWRLPKRDVSNSFALFLLIGGFGSSVAYFVITIAGFGSAANWLTPVQYITLSGMNGMLAFLGGIRVCRKKNMH